MLEDVLQLDPLIDAYLNRLPNTIDAWITSTSPAR